MVVTAKKLMTADEFWDFVHLPANEDRDFERIRGEVVEVSRPGNPHGIVCARIVTLLQNHADRLGRGYVTCNDAGIVLRENPATVVAPDVGFFTDVNRFEDVHLKWNDPPPILAVEIASPTDRPGKVNAKIREYLTCGVKMVWQIDYEELNVTIHRPEKTLEIVAGENELTGGEDLPGFVCRLSDLFRLPGDTTTPANPAQPPSPAT